jgi:DNA gyrase subunit A
VASRIARGKAIANLLQLENGERVSSLLPVAEFSEDRYLITATRKGQIKKTQLNQYSNIRRSGIIATRLREGDTLIGASITDGSQEIIMATRKGRAIRFPEKNVRAMGRASSGVRGIRFNGDDDVVGMVVVGQGATLMTVTENGFGKRSALEGYRITARGGKGVVNIKTTEKNGEVVSIMEVQDHDQLMMITKNGIVIRCPVEQVRVMGRYAQGVKLISLEANDRVVDVAHLAVEDEANGE